MNNKISQYRVLQGSTIVQLENYIEAGIEQGWQPLGGVSVVSSPVSIGVNPNGRVVYVQAVVQYKESEE